MFFADTPRTLRLGFAGAIGADEPHLSVDGMTPVGPNLSHWPGNRTPGKWKADLSTAICLRFASSPPAEQAEFIGDATCVLNDHYDTDGFGSLLAVLRPDIARMREELLIAAAATGDFGSWQTWRGFAIDRIVARLDHPSSPLHRAFAGITDPAQRALHRYAWLLEHATAVLDQPGQFAALYADEMALVQQQIDRGLRGGIDRRRFDGIGFAAVTSDGPLHRMTLNTLAGAYRVLHVQNDCDGTRFRYHDRTESWFELVTFHPLPRLDLRPLAAHLGTLEPERDGASWNADPPDEPIPELYFGVPSRQEYGQLTRELRPSQLPAERIAAAFATFFARAASVEPSAQG
jgi:hypothetical protein